jgi:hypothetical protein
LQHYLSSEVDDKEYQERFTTEIEKKGSDGHNSVLGSFPQNSTQSGSVAPTTEGEGGDFTDTVYHVATS